MLRRAALREGGGRGEKIFNFPNSPEKNPKMDSPPKMDSLLFLCARLIVRQRPLPVLPACLYPVLFQAAFLDGRPLALRDLVASWPFENLNFQEILGGSEVSLRDSSRQLCVQAVILALVKGLRREMEEPGEKFSLRVLDVTGFPEPTSRRAPDGTSVWSGTVALAKACVELAEHRREFRRRASKRRKNHRGDAADPPPPPPPGVDVRADLSVDAASYGVVRRALRLGAAGGLLRLRCRDFRAEELPAAALAELLESLDPSRVRRVDLRFNNLGWAGLSVVLPRLSRFPELRGLRLPYGNADARRATPGSAAGIRCLAARLGTLPGLRELNLGSSRLSGNLRPILCALPAPLESLELPFCSLLPADLAFLSRSCHAPALRRLDLSGHDFSSRGLLEPLRLLLERSSASLLLLDLSECRLADAQLDALLPALRRCSRLRFLGLRGNSLSAAALRELLRETLELPDLRLVVYPGADDCDSWDSVPDESEFSRILADSGRSDAVWTRNPYGRHEGLDYFSL